MKNRDYFKEKVKKEKHTHKRTYMENIENYNRLVVGSEILIIKVSNSYIPTETFN